MPFFEGFFTNTIKVNTHKRFIHSFNRTETELDLQKFLLKSKFVQKTSIKLKITVTMKSKELLQFEQEKNFKLKKHGVYKSNMSDLISLLKKKSM